MLSGVHGDERFSSSAIQCAALDRWSAEPLGDVRIVFVHAVNPWRMANWRRQTESNVDLNRNFIDFDSPLPTNEDYDVVAADLVPAGYDEESRAAADTKEAGNKTSERTQNQKD